MGKDRNMSTNSTILIIGFALFASFFGAGNLIFPPSIGIAAGKNWLSALLGFSISGVLLPVLSFVAVVRAGGTEEGIASEMGRAFSLTFSTIVMLCTSLLIGVPRTAATTHELGIAIFFPSVPQLWTSCIFFAIVIALTFNPTKVVENIGKYLTPALIAIMTLIVVKGVIMPLGVPGDTGLDEPFRKGFIDGYQTLDIFAGLVFSGTIYGTIVTCYPEDQRRQLKVVGGCTAVAGICLLFVYGGLLYLGATGTAIFSPNTPHAALLIGFIDNLFGSLGHQALAFAAVFACLTTAIGLTAGASNFFRRLTRGRLPYKFNVVVICVVSLLISTLGVEAIVRYATPVLICIYPTSIVLVLLNVFRCPLINKGTFLGAAYSTLLVGFFEMLPALGFPIDRTLSVLEILPFATHGFAWTAPAVVFGVLGTLLYRMWGKKA